MSYHVLLDDHGYPLIWVRLPSRLRTALTVIAEFTVLVGLFIGWSFLLWLLSPYVPQ